MDKMNLISRGIAFVKKNPTVVYSVFLVLAVTAAIFWNSYYALSRFEKSTGELIVSKAALAEKVFGVLSADLLVSPEALQMKINQLKSEADDISAIVVLKRSDDHEGFSTIASTDPNDVGSVRNEIPYLLAWSEESGTAFVSNQNGSRYWNVIKSVRTSDGEKKGLVFFQLSLQGSDAFAESVIRQVYVAAFSALFFVLLLLLNHLRFSRYALRAVRLEEVDRMKDDFISMASHELKSPITILRGYADLLKSDLNTRGGVAEAQSIEYVVNMESTLKRLGTLVDDLLNVSRLEQNRLPIEIRSIDLGETLRPLIVDFSIAAKEKGLELRCQEFPAVSVSADPERVKQILVNLLSNAVKYTQKGEVSVKVEAEDDAVSVTVADSGIGLTAEALGNLFAKFYRVRTAETEKISGTGLGLWIAREIARKMGGDLTVESIHGVGSHFTLRLKKVKR